MKKYLMVGLLSALSFSAIADKHAEDSINYRKSVFKIVKWHMGSMGGMVKGKIDYNADTFMSDALALHSISQLAHNGFKLESPAKNSRSKPEIWAEGSDFNKIMQEFVDSSGKLAEVSKSKDLNKIKPAFLATAKTCKSCHKEYRFDKK